MTDHPDLTPDDATDLLRQVETIHTRIRGNAGWPAITAQMSMGAAMFFPTAVVRMLLAVVITAASFVGALVEARR